MTVSLTKFGHNTEYRVPPEGAGARVSHNQFFYGKITSLSNEFRTPARFSCGSSGVAGTISEYYEFEDGYRIVMVLNDDSDSDFNTPESVTIVSTTGTETAQLDAWEKIIVSDISIIDPLNPENHLSIDNLGSASIRFAEGQPILSGFGSLKTAEEVAIGVYESSIDSYETLFHKFISGGGSFLYSANQSSHILSTDTSSGSSIRMTTNRSHYYLPGTSNVYKMTMSCGDTGKTGNLRRWGAFDENDGVFFELYENTLNVVLRSSATGSAVETKVPSNLWNGDRLDGSGLSGYTLDVTKINVWWMDFQWLGAGRVRFGIFSPEGARVVCHTFQNAGNRALPYMRTGTLPASVENTNFGATGSSSELRNVCIGVYSEGDVLKSYTFWRYSTGILSKTVSTPQTLIAAYRAVATVNGKRNLVQIFPETLNVYCTAPVGITLFQTADYNGTVWDNAGAGSVLERSTDGTFVYANSESFTTFFCNTGVNTFDLSRFFELNDEGILVGADGTPKIWALVSSPLTDTAAEVKVNVSYKELW